MQIYDNNGNRQVILLNRAHMSGTHTGPPCTMTATTSYTP